MMANIFMTKCLVQHCTMVQIILSPNVNKYKIYNYGKIRFTSVDFGVNAILL